MSKVIGTKPNQIPVNANLGELAYQDKEDLGLDGKVDKVAGKGLSSEDFTSAEKSKLSGIATGATNTAAPVQSDWNAGSGLAAIANKPGNATTSADGLMSKEDKTKLNAVGTNAQGDKTVSTLEPSGGSNGDIWMKVE